MEERQRDIRLDRRELIQKIFFEIRKEHPDWTARRIFDQLNTLSAPKFYIVPRTAKRAIRAIESQKDAHLYSQPVFIDFYEVFCEEYRRNPNTPIDELILKSLEHPAKSFYIEMNYNKFYDKQHTQH